MMTNILSNDKDEYVFLLKQDLDVNLESLLDETNHIALYDVSKDMYKPEVIQCVMNLQNLNVSSRNIGPAILEILKPDRVQRKQLLKNSQMQKF